MHVRWILAAAAALAVAAACNKDQQSIAPAADANVALDKQDGGRGFRTEQPAQAEILVSGARLVPIITTGDILPGSNLPWGPVPDGLGAYRDGRGITVFANHEITASGVTSSNGGPAFLFSRVSRLQIDPSSLKVLNGDYAEDGSGGYIRFCSATWADGTENLPSGYFLTGEENGATARGSVVLAVSGQGQKTELPHLGAFSHENTVPVPGYDKVVVLGTDDSQGQSELYLYVARNEEAFLSGDQSEGRLYVFRTEARSAAGNPLHAGNMQVGETIKGFFVPIDDPADLGAAPADRYNRLQAKVDALDAMPFVRLEDADYVRGRRHARGEPTAYFVDTGAESTTGRPQVGADCAGPCDPYGSIYKIELSDDDPTKRAELTLVARSSGPKSGWSSPDNIALSRKSIMLMEDPANTQWDGSRAPGIWNASLYPRGRVGVFQEVAQVTQESLIPGPGGQCIDASGLCWETSGIISTDELLGPGTWLFNVQAHTYPFTAGTGADAKQYSRESGQLLYLRVPGS
jgi:hypothetical protein